MTAHILLRFAISIVLLVMSSKAISQQESSNTGHPLNSASEDSHSDNLPVNELSVAYARACLRLANAELAEAREQNHLFNKSVSDYDIQRLQLQVRFAEENLSRAEQGADISQSLVEHVALQSHLADVDLKTAEDLDIKQQHLISKAHLERLRSNAEVCRLRMELTRNPESTLKLVDHLHWETHRLSEEILQLNRRIARLEELANR